MSLPLNLLPRVSKMCTQIMSQSLMLALVDQFEKVFDQFDVDKLAKDGVYRTSPLIIWKEYLVDQFEKVFDQF
jgi:D-arabinose 5-phosphate isomerase GutQ